MSTYHYLDPKTAFLEPPEFISNPRIQRSAQNNNTITVYDCSFRATQQIEEGSFFLEIFYTNDFITSSADLKRIEMSLDMSKSLKRENFFQYTFNKFDFQSLEYFGQAYRCVIQNPFGMNINVSSNITYNGIRLSCKNSGVFYCNFVLFARYWNVYEQ